jgi:hypothetical protein
MSKYPLTKKMEEKYFTLGKEQQNLVWKFASLTESIHNKRTAMVMRYRCLEFQYRLKKNQIPITPEEDIIGG